MNTSDSVPCDARSEFKSDVSQQDDLVVPSHLFEGSLQVLEMPDLPSQTPPRAQSGIGAHKQPIEGDPDRSTSARPFAEPQNLNVGSISFRGSLNGSGK